MIITEKIEMKIHKNTKNKNYFRYKGYIINDTTDKIYVNINDLPESSTFKVLSKCDICGNEVEIEYRGYLKNIQNQNYFTCSKKCSREKYKTTCLEKFGYDNTFKSPEIKERIKQTNVKTYGCENPFGNDLIKDKIEKTNIEKYGCKSPTQNKEIKEKIKETNKERYGVDSYTKTIECKNKVKSTNMERYGVVCSLHNKDINKKVIENNILKYGVKYPMQNENVFYKQRKSGYMIKTHKETGLSYQGTYEKHFLDFCIDNNISVTRGKKIDYIFENTSHKYYSDFYIEKWNLIVEIKSLWIYNIDLEKNIEKKKYTEIYGYNFLFVIDKCYTNLLNYIE